jgi:flagellar protein FliO/FliZ
MTMNFKNPQPAAYAAHGPRAARVAALSALVLALAPAVALAADAPTAGAWQPAATTATTKTATTPTATTPAAPSKADDARASRYQEDRPLGISPSAEPAGGGKGGGGLGRTIFGLAIVLAVIFGVHWVLKQLKRAGGPRATGGGLSSVATLPLGRNRTLHLVRAGEDVVLVGVTEQQIVPVRTWSDEEAEALLASLPHDDDEDGDGDGDGEGRQQRGLQWALEQLRRRTVRR